MEIEVERSEYNSANIPYKAKALLLILASFTVDHFKPQKNWAQFASWLNLLQTQWQYILEVLRTLPCAGWQIHRKEHQSVESPTMYKWTDFDELMQHL